MNATTIPVTSAVPTPILDEAAANKLKFGTGRYSAEQQRLHEDSMNLFRFTDEQALKFARQATADFGNLMKDVTVKLAIGKMNADGKATMGEVCSRKGVTLTNSLTLVRAIQWIKDAERNGVSYGFTRWEVSRMNDNLQEYVRNL